VIVGKRGRQAEPFLNQPLVSDQTYIGIRLLWIEANDWGSAMCLLAVVVSSFVLVI
jgi:hypothetical protein